MPIADCKIIHLPKISDPRGNLTFVEGTRHVPFDIRRVYYLYDVPGGSDRGAHAHKELHQLMIAVSGSFRIVLDDGYTKTTFSLTKPFEGLYIGPMVWRDLGDFCSGAVCMVLASDYYQESDYYRDYAAFRKDVQRLCT